MFRISQYMQELAQPTPLGPKRNPPGPVVIWNLVRRCNLTCKHCYSISADKDFPGELSTDEVFTVMDDLKRFHVPVLILSGGVSEGAFDLVEPVLLRFDVGLLFTKVAIKPGAPLVFGRRGDKLVFGLPGNPVSAQVTFDLFVRPPCCACRAREP